MLSFFRQRLCTQASTVASTSRLAFAPSVRHISSTQPLIPEQEHPPTVDVDSTPSAVNTSTVQATQPPKRYGVTRTRLNGALPVYSNVRQNGLRNEVLIRKVFGDLRALQADLKKSFGSRRDGLKIDIAINDRTSAIVITGADKPSVMEVKTWLGEQGL